MNTVIPRTEGLLAHVMAARESGVELTRGFHSEARRMLMGFILKIIHEGQPMPLAEAQSLCDKILTYAHQLEQVGIKAAFPMLITPVMGLDGWHIISIDLDHGDDLKKIIAESDAATCLRAVGEMLAATRRIFNYRISVDSLEVEVGIDLKPANFTMDENGVLYYIDLMPPRFREAGDALLDYPEHTDPVERELAYFRYFHMGGMLIDMHVQLCRVRPELCQDFRDMILNSARATTGLEEYLLEFKGHSFSMSTDANERIRIIESLCGNEVNAARDIFCQLYYENPGAYDTSDFGYFFEITSFNDGSPLHRTDMIRDYLLRMGQGAFTNSFRY